MTDSFPEFIASRRYAACAQMEVQRLRPSAKMAAYGSALAAGLDLHADLEGHPQEELARQRKMGQPDAEKVLVIQPGERRIIKTGIAISLPVGRYGRVAPRSGLSVKLGLDIMAGVIDEDYRGEIGVVAINLGHDPIIITQDMRVAQLIIESYTPVHTVEVAQLDATNRGTGGFGSTGA
jgi:dUTP pyrophosphatase